MCDLLVKQNIPPLVQVSMDELFWGLFIQIVGAHTQKRLVLRLRMFGDLVLVRRGGGVQGGLLVCMVPRLMGVRIDGGTGRCTLMFMGRSCLAVWPTQESVNEGSPYTDRT